jgi:uncharacterized caspase-like protein
MIKFLRPLLLLILFLSGSIAVAQSAGQGTGRKVALIIANGSYANTSALTNPTNDARLVADSAKRAGFETVTLATNLSLAQFQRTLRDFREKATGAQVAMVYYAGHGIEGSGKNWLIPVDAALNSDLDLPYEAIDLERVLESVSGAQVRMIVLDACRNNPFGRSWRSVTRAVNRGLSGVEVDDVLVIYAAAPGQTASDGDGGNSPFATSLAKRLTQADLPLQLLGGTVRDDVLASTGGSQRPFVSASITGTPFYLVPRSAASGAAPAKAPAQVAASVDEATLDALAWQGALGANSADAFREYKSQFPKGRFVRLADQNITRIDQTAPAPSRLPQSQVQTAPVRPAQQMTGGRLPPPALIFPSSSTKLVTFGQLAGMSLPQLRLARNEIFARNGFDFASPDLKGYFQRFDWYQARTTDIQLNPIEKRNIGLFQEAERSRGAGR